MNRGPVLIESTSLSHAWFETFQVLLVRGVDAISPLIVSISFDEEQLIDDIRVRCLLNQWLIDNGLYTCETTANTIFPSSLWYRHRDRNIFYRRYEEILPELKKLAPQNRNGLYFERLIRYGSHQERSPYPINQLEHIIQTFSRRNHRNTALQASIFDPEKDHTHQRRRGFPCLQHVLFTPTENNCLTTTGIYATQYIFDRAYGNSLGLYYLGCFMAHEMGLRLSKVNVFVTKGELGSISKESGRTLVDNLQRFLE